jgi:O-antigen/teichoic acid export membrane protein
MIVPEVPPSPGADSIFFRVKRIFGGRRRAENLIASSTWHLIEVVCVRGLGFVKNIFLLNYFGAAVFGQFAMGLNLISWLEPVVTVGTVSATQRFVPDHVHNRSFRAYLANGLLLSVLTTVVLLAFLLAGANWISAVVFRGEIAAPVLHVAFVGVFSQVLFHFAYSIQRARKRFFASAVINISYALFLQLAAVAFFLVVPSTNAALGGHIAVSAVLGITGIFLLFRSEESMDGRAPVAGASVLWRRLVGFGFFVALAAISEKTVVLTMQVLIARYTGAKDLAAFVAVLALANIPMILSTFITNVTYPHFAFKYTYEDSASVNEMFLFVAKTSLVAFALIGVMLAVSKSYLVPFLYRGNADAGLAYVDMLIVFCIYRGLIQFLQSAFKLVKKMPALTVVSFGYAGSNLVFCLLAVPSYGAAGATAAGLLTTIAAATAGLWFLHRSGFRVSPRLAAAFVLPLLILLPEVLPCPPALSALLVLLVAPLVFVRGDWSRLATLVRAFLQRLSRR